MSKDGTSRGGARPGAGRKPKAISEKIASGNPGGRKLTVVDFGDEAINLKGTDMPPVKDYLKARQKDGSTTCAEAIYKETWDWLHERKCDQLIPVQQIAGSNVKKRCLNSVFSQRSRQAPLFHPLM